MEQNRGMPTANRPDAELLRITIARESADIADARALFEEYARGVGVDLCFQGFARELAGLPGDYAAPRGRLYLARSANPSAGEPGGCIALRPLDVHSGEIKRLYVRPAYRGCGLGRRLAEQAIEAAREAGYRRVVLDTLAHMQEAIRLYRSLGFDEIPAYYDNPIPGALYFERRLAP